MKVACIRCRRPDQVEMSQWQTPCEYCKKDTEGNHLSDWSKKAPSTFKQAVGLDFKISQAHEKDIRSRFYTPDGEVATGERGRRLQEAVINDQKKGIDHKWK